MSKVINFSYKLRRHGHDFKLIETKDELGFSWEIAGWCKGINPDDILLLGLDKNDLRVYKVDSIKYCANPNDMFFALISWLSNIQMTKKQIKMINAEISKVKRYL